MRIIGLTGPSGTGKSTVSKVAAGLGYFVIDCDRVAAEVRAFKETTDVIGKAFPGVVKEGIIDKTALAMEAFKDKESTEKLNSLILPLIVKEMDSKILAAEKEGYEYCLLDAPTLFESGADKKCDAVIAVLAADELRKSRIAKRDSLSKELLKRRLSAAKPDDYYTAKTGNIIYNNAGVEELVSSASRLLNKLKEI